MPAAPTICLVSHTITVCVLKVFPFVIFERGISLSFLYGIYGHENLFS